PVSVSPAGLQSSRPDGRDARHPREAPGPVRDRHQADDPARPRDGIRELALRAGRGRARQVAPVPARGRRRRVIGHRAASEELGQRAEPPAPVARHGLDRYRGLLLFLLPLALAAVRYYPITGNYFFADDFLNLYHIADDPVPQYLITPNGGHVLLTRNA